MSCDLHLHTFSQLHTLVDHVIQANWTRVGINSPAVANSIDLRRLLVQRDE